MKITIDTLKAAFKKHNYKWFENDAHVVGIRTSLQVPDAFNDFICLVWKNEILLTATCTTEPGTTYQKKLLNPKGCWVMMPAQMVDAYSIGFHQGKADHVCLKSSGKIYGLREDDKDGIVLNDKDAVASWQEGSGIGANIHGANKAGVTKVVGPWSAGCQVLNVWKDKEKLIELCKNSGQKKFTYTLLDEKSL
jgi:hypothetical protein